MKLTLQSRDRHQIEIQITKEDDLHQSAYLQQRLSELYRQYDILCHCQAEPVVMHIRYRSGTDLYFVADNPSSPRHQQDCTFHSMRQNISDHKYDPTELKPLDAFHPYSSRNPSEQSNPSPIYNSNKAPISTPLKTFATLCENAFATYNFGRFTSFKDFVSKIINSEKNKHLMTPWGKSISDCIHFGPNGLKIAKNNVQKYKPVDQSIPTTIWFGYAPEGTKFDVGFVEIKGELLTFTHLHEPYKMPGPHILCGFIAQTADQNKPLFRDLLVVPIVSKSYCLAIHNQHQRQFALSFFPTLFGLNNKKNGTYFIKKPLWPFLEEGELVYTDWLFTKKNKVGHRTSSKTVVIEHGERHDLLADVYGTLVCSETDAIYAFQQTSSKAL